MNILSIDTSGGACSAATSRDGALVAEKYMHIGFNHSVVLMPLVDDLLRTAGVSMQEIGLFAVTIGPGSFTGLRIGVSTVKAFAQATGKPVAPVGTLDLLAQNFSAFPGILCPMLDARRDRVYTCVYRQGKKILQDTVEPIGSLAERLSKEPAQPLLFLGDGVDVYKDFFTASFPRALFAPEFLRYQRASAAMDLAAAAFAEGRALSCFDVRLQYLTKSQAERNLRR